MRERAGSMLVVDMVEHAVALSPLVVYLPPMLLLTVLCSLYCTLPLDPSGSHNSRSVQVQCHHHNL